MISIHTVMKHPVVITKQFWFDSSNFLYGSAMWGNKLMFFCLSLEGTATLCSCLFSSWWFLLLRIQLRQLTACLHCQYSANSLMKQPGLKEKDSLSTSAASLDCWKRATIRFALFQTKTLILSRNLVFFFDTSNCLLSLEEVCIDSTCCQQNIELHSCK